MFISIVIPCYNEEQAIAVYYEALTKAVAPLQANFELVFVDDGSTDQTLANIKALPERTGFAVRYLSFSRNFGKEAALLAGLRAAEGDYVCIMDVDLQDPPALLPEMIRILSKGEADCVATKSVSRHGYSPLRKLFTKIYYKLINRISKTEIVTGARDYRIMTRQMTDAVLLLTERNRFCKGIFSWVGFKTEWLTFENTERVNGTTKWNFFSLTAYALESVAGFSTSPLLISIGLGLLFMITAAVLLIFCIIQAVQAVGSPALFGVLSALFFAAGAQLGCLGILGFYFSKAYFEIKARPHYIIKESNTNPPAGTAGRPEADQ